MIVRRKGGLAALPEFNQKLDAVLAEGTVWNGIIKEVGAAAPVYESNPYSLFHPASMIKIPLAMLVLHGLETQGFSPRTCRCSTSALKRSIGCSRTW
jgi:hypothetical protein